MSDEADMAAEIVAESLARGLAGISAAIPAGVAGDCDNCCDHFARLVGGLCGFCRDGRLPRFGRTPIEPVAAPTPAPAPTPRPPSSPSEEEADVPGPKYAIKTLSVPIEDAETLLAIERYAKAADLAMGRAGAELIERGLEALTREPAPARDAPAPHDGNHETTAAWLAHVPNALLIAEIDRRVGDGVDQQQADALTARATAAEGQLATVREQVKQLLGSIAA